MIHQFDCFSICKSFIEQEQHFFKENGMYIQIPVKNYKSDDFQPPCDGMKKLFWFTVGLFRCPNVMRYSKS